MRTIAILTAAAAAIGTAAVAAPAPGAAPAAAPAAPTCPASGYTKPIYGTFGTNDGFNTAYEIAGPCIPRALRDAAQAVGMGRNVPLGVKNVSTIRFSAEGSMGALKTAKLGVHISYVVPGIRMEVDGTDAKGKSVKETDVFADGKAWNEAVNGVDPKPAPPVAAADRLAWIKLTPFGAMWSVIEAEGHATVSMVNGQQVVTGASPYDGVPVTVTFDAKHLPVHVLVKTKAHRYEASFDGWTDTWEPHYLVIFPAHMVWTLDGKPYADLKTTEFKSNPYVVFPELGADTTKVAENK